MTQGTTMTLTVAAYTLGLTYSQVRERMLRGTLEGMHLDGKWFVTEASVLRYRAQLEAERAAAEQPQAAAV